MLMRFVLVKLLEFRGFLRRALVCFRVVAENVDDIIDMDLEFNKPSNSSSAESLSSE
tara:strand:- start:3021 stop:3191 length:171 start_codon:yes stop_codon:yes gene_type:complete